MIFSELYSAYYSTVAHVLQAAVEHPLHPGELQQIVAQNAFGESILQIEPAFAEQRWQLLHADGTTPLHAAPTMPCTMLQKRWLKAISLDPRIRLFTDGMAGLESIEPLFRPEDICVFDKYADGDPYESETYIRHFRLILDAIRHKTPLSINARNRKGTANHLVMLPESLEYSEKDDKFRLIGSGCRYGNVVNLGRVIDCTPYTKPFAPAPGKVLRPKARQVTFTLVDERNALERVLLHFAHFAKQAEKLSESQYRVTVAYDRDDETEVLIRILSFGPMIKVTAPESFVELIRARLISQKSCEQ